MIFIVVSIITTMYLKKKYVKITPSSIIIAFFLLIPFVGIMGYKNYIDIYGCYMGGKLNFDYPLFVWYLGASVFTFSVLIFHIVIRDKGIPMHYVWKTEMLQKSLKFFILISLFFTLLSIVKIGYIPIFKGNIDVERFMYRNIVGDYTSKFSKLWIIAFFISSYLFCIEVKSRKRYLLIMIVCGFFLSIYGQRMYLLICFSYFALIFIKFNKKIDFKKLIVFLAIIVLMFLSIAQLRGDWNYKLKSLSPVKQISIKTFGEWKEYSYVLNKFTNESGFLKHRIFTGVFAAIVPKQVWLMVGQDKNELLSFNAPAYFGEYFGHYAGIRIGIIGEAYVGYGILGVVILMFVLGFLVVLLEKKYLLINKYAPELSVYVFFMSILVFLPLISFITLTTMFLYAFFLYVNTFFCRIKFSNLVNQK
ncbi:MAG: O-antigen polymerase [Candidatus Omnitrophota bacterium]